MPHRHEPRARRRPPGRRRRGRARHRRGRRGVADWARMPWEERAAVFLRAAELLAGPWRADAQRRDDARPVEDRAPGRDRRGLRADRLLALQRRVHGADLRGAADLAPGHLEPDGAPPARGLRLRGHAVQLHRDRRQPAARAGADGQHGRVEAGRRPRRSRRLVPDAAARGGGPAAAASINFVHGPGARDRRRRARAPRARAASTSPARPASSTAMWKTIGDNVDALPQLPADRRRDRRQGLHRRAPDAPTSTRSRPRSCAAPSSTRARSARPRRASTRRRACGPSCASSCVEQVGDARGRRRRRLLELHGRGHRRRLVRDAARRRSTRRARTATEIVAGGGYDDSEGWFVEPTVIETRRPELPH